MYSMKRNEKAALEEYREKIAHEEYIRLVNGHNLKYFLNYPTIKHS